MKKDNFKFIDICSGIGGFHQVMKRHGGKCVFASEIDPIPAKVYKDNYNIDSLQDITKVNIEDIPYHDVLCAGFPCVSFSKAGHQKGFEDIRGQIFFYIAKILEYHKPKYVVLENVRNLVNHDNGNTWSVISKVLKELGYGITEIPIICNPIQLGIPQYRERVVILGVYGEDTVKIFNDLLKNQCNSILTDFVFETNPDEKYKISIYEEQVLQMWDDFKQGIKERILGFPVWGSYLKVVSDKELENLPDWKKKIILKNQELYLNNKQFIDFWLHKYNYFEGVKPTHCKFEWQVGDNIQSVWEGIIQFRPSGVRVKKPDYFPALVAMVQIPIIGPLKRRLTPREAARLQGFPEDFIYDKLDKFAYKQFGNAINVDIVDYFVSKMFEKY